MTRTQSISVLAMIWTAWCFMHSLLISRNFAGRMERILGSWYGYYRLAYTFFSLFSLVPVIYFQLNITERVIFAWPWPWQVVKLGLYGAAFLLFYGGFRVYDLQYMLGIRQIHEMKYGNKRKSMDFTTEGILAYVRHPWYSGAILLVWAFAEVTDVSLVSKAILTGYIIVGAMLEEQKLMHEIGEPYVAYRKKVPMFIPWKKR